MASIHFRLPAALLVAGLILTPLRAQQPPLPEQLFPQLQGYLSQAASQSPRMINRNLDLEIADANRVTARAGMLPSVYGSYRLTETRDQRQDVAGSFSAEKVYYDVSVNQPLFHWGALKNNARIGEIQQQIAKGNYREGYRLLAQEVRSQYLQLVIRKAQVGRGEYHLESSRVRLKLAEERFAARAIAEGEIALARLTVEQAELALDRAIEDFSSARHAFSRLIGATSPIEAAAIPDGIPVTTYQAGAFDSRVAGIVAQGELPTNEARNYRHLIEQETLTYKMHQARLRPKFNLVAGATQDEQSFTVNTAQRYRLDSLYAGVHLNWSIFDGFAARAAQRSSLARRRQLENDFRTYTENMRANLQAQARQLGFAARSMSIADRSVEGNEGLLNLRRKEVTTGLASETDVRTAELAVLDSRINAFAQRLDFLMKASELAGLTATDPALANLAEE